LAKGEGSEYGLVDQAYYSSNEVKDFSGPASSSSSRERVFNTIYLIILIPFPTRTKISAALPPLPQGED